MNRIFAYLTLTTIALLLLAACGVGAQPTAQTGNTPVAPVPSASGDPQTTPSTPSAAQEPIVIVRAEGGMCRAGACGSEKQIMADGSYLATDGAGLRKNGTLPAADVAKLAELIAAADFKQIGSQPFTGTCPLAFDGQEFIYTFPTADGAPTFASCKVAIDENDPLFQQIGALVERINQETAS